MKVAFATNKEFPGGRFLSVVVKINGAIAGTLTLTPDELHEFRSAFSGDPSGENYDQGGEKCQNEVNPALPPNA